MGIFGGQFANVIEWEEYRDDIIFWRWDNREIKKGSKLVIHQGQDAIFLYNGKVEGLFTDEGSFDMESDIIPFLSSLKGFKFGFNSGIRAEVLFVNTKEFTVKWGTKSPIVLPAPGLVGGMPIRAFGTFHCKVGDYLALIDKVAGIKKQYTIDDVKERVVSMLDQLLMKWISKEGRDMFNLQASAFDISRGICSDLDMEMTKIGLSITGFNIQSVSYPDEVQKMVNKVASQSMVGDMGRYQQMAMTDALTSDKDSGAAAGANMASQMAGMGMGMAMAQQMAGQMNQTMGQGTSQPGSHSQGQNNQGQPAPNQTGAKTVNFCPNCGSKTDGANFCPDCGQKLN